MCPACLAHMLLIAAGITSSGGITALTVNRFLRRKQSEINQSKREQNETSRERNGNRIAS